MISRPGLAAPPLYTLFILAGVLLLSACTAAQPATGSPPSNDKLKVAATTTLIGDVVAVIGGDNVELSVLLPVGAEPHSFQPTPKDIAALSQADLVFVNGLDLEEVLMPTLVNAVDDAKIIAVSDGVATIKLAAEAGHADEDEHGHEGVDPHTWTDPNNVIVWTGNINRALVAADPDHAAAYTANAEAYTAKLRELDAWVQEQVAQVPVANRRLITDHAVFGYFAHRYGFEQVGTVMPGFSTLAEPSAREMAALEDTIRSLGVKALFTGNTVNPGLAQRVATDTGTRLISVYSDSLSDASGPAPTYLEWVRYNTQAFVDALK